MSKFVPLAGLLLASLAALQPSAKPPVADAPGSPSPLESYRKLQYPPTEDNFDKGWKERVALEFDIVNAADVKSLRDALKDRDAYVRAMAARALGIRADKSCVDELAELAKNDPNYIVRI